ncbi:uncharacterized protein LOC113854084 isoform X2 [Abrus precatorius]|uniref:Uncharacterized protein LOC113854084 isoform X2 n=1 Tax=Abrus precatorius TaxID=3816 RepID=A0A8B8KC15_ABRPR|nr:uncharacterized protein LOC113854084 isoform X2 [Abrus precatorius]
MDAVELPLPVDVAATPKLMGSEGFARAKEVIVTHSNSIDCCNSRLIQNETQFSKNSCQLPQLNGDDLSKNTPSGNDKSCPVITSRLEGVTLQRKAAKSNRSNSSCSKRPRMSQTEDSVSPNGIEESKDISDRSHNLKCTSPEKSQLPKQKSNASKRGEKRNFKVPSAKAKFESSSLKMGASIFSSTCGGNNFFGLYGLKHDFHDVTKLMDEPSLDELLKGTFNCPILSKDKGKKTSNMNESFLNLVRKAFSILQFPKSVRSQNMTEMDYSSNMKMSTCQLSSVCLAESVGNGDKEQSCTTDMSSCQKDPCSETESTASPLDLPLRQPKDILEQIALHPFRDLDSLLLDVSKLAITTKNSNDQRSGKQVSRRPSLPAFPWSHAFGGHSRTNSDTVKLSTSRSSCQGKWTRIGFVASSIDIDRSCFTNLDSFSYDQSLVPSSCSSDKRIFPSLFANLPFHQLDSSSVSCSEDSQVKAEFGGQIDTKENDERCPRILTAAQTLCEIATNSPRQSSDGTLRWQRKTSHKTMKACFFKSNEKLEEMSSRQTSVVGSDMTAKSVEQIMPSKKPRLSVVENKNSGHSNNIKKGPYAWPSSKSSRSSLPSKQVRDLFVENKRTNASILKQHFMMPPPARDLDKAYDGQQQVGKLVVMDWKRGRENTD